MQPGSRHTKAPGLPPRIFASPQTTDARWLPIHLHALSSTHRWRDPARQRRRIAAIPFSSSPTLCSRDLWLGSTLTFPAAKPLVWDFLVEGVSLPANAAVSYNPDRSVTGLSASLSLMGYGKVRLPYTETSAGFWLIPMVRGFIALRECEASGEFNFSGN